MKKQTKKDIKGLLISILVLSIILIVAYITIDQVKQYNNACVYNKTSWNAAPSFKHGMQEANCSIPTGVYDYEIINGKCFINCSKYIETMSVVQ